MISHLKLRLAASAFTLAAVLQPTHAHCQPMAATSAEQRMPHISVVAMGTGSPVILIPGLASPRAVWDGVAPALAKHHRVYLVQVNGFGGDAPGGNLKPGILNGVVADLDALVTKEKLGKPAIVGHSMGGLIGLMFAKAHPNRIGRLMVVDSLPFVGEIFVPGATVAMVEPQAARMRAAMSAAYGQPKNPASAQALAAQLALKPASREKMAAWSSQADSRVAGEAMYEDMTTDLRPIMPTLTTPITAIYPAAGDALYRNAYRATNTTYVPVADTAHFVMLDQPDAFAATLDRFLQ